MVARSEGENLITVGRVGECEGRVSECERGESECRESE